MSDQWHLLNDGQQYGPYSGEDLMRFVQEGRIVRDSMLWTDGMENWVAATAIEGLFPAAPAPAPVTAPAAAAAPAPAAPRSVAAGNPASRTSPRAATAGRAPTQRAQTSKQTAPARPVGPYPPVAIKPANFELLITLLGSGLTLLVIAYWAFWTMGQSDKPMPGMPVDEAAKANQLLMLEVILAAASGCLIWCATLTYMYLYRLWEVLQHGRPRTTPGMAVGLMFVPGLNVYWVFVAFYGLAKDWNRITNRYADLNRAPQMNEGLFLAYCCCSILVAPIGLILWFPVMQQVCRAIGFMALSPQHRARVSKLR